MKLIYRAQLIEFTPPPVQPYQKPRALNWRYQVLDFGQKRVYSQIYSAKQED